MTKLALRALREDAPAPEQPRSQTRLRVSVGCRAEMAIALQGVEATVREHGTKADAGIVTALAMVERAAGEVERWTRELGCSHVTRAWLDACGEWMTGVAAALTCAFAYDGAQRRVAMELAAEESSVLLLMGVEREGAETVAVLRNLDRGASRAASELATRIDLADRVLHAAATAPASAATG